METSKVWIDRLWLVGHNHAKSWSKEDSMEVGASTKVGMMMRFAEKIIFLPTKPSRMSGSKKGLAKGKSGIW